MASSAHSAIDSLACVIGRNVGGYLDTKSPRLVTYRVTSKPVVYVDEDNGTCLHDHPRTESFQFTVTMHPDGSVEGVTTLLDYAENSPSVTVDGMTLMTGYGYPFTASCFFSSTGERSSATMSYDTIEHMCDNFSHVDDLEKRAACVAADTKRLQTGLATSKVCTMVFDFIADYESTEHPSNAQVTILKAPFRIDVSRWSRGVHSFPDDERRNQRDCEAARVDFEVATIELVTGMTVERPVFS
jgi:hypothetical protein